MDVAVGRWGRTASVSFERIQARVGRAHPNTTRRLSARRAGRREPASQEPVRVMDVASAVRPERERFL